MLDAAITDQLRTHFASLTRPVTLVASLDDSPRSAEVSQLLDELSALSKQVTVEAGEDPRRPSFAVTSSDTAGVHFAGLPLGHEFTSLVLAILQAGGRPSTADPAVLARADGLAGPLRFETFFSQSCQNCPDVVQALNLLATRHPGIEHVAIDGAAFQAEASDREVLAVPTVFLNGEPWGQGRMTLEDIVDRLDTAGTADKVAELDAREPYDVLVVGGGPAGASAAIYAGRKGIRTALVADRIGGQVLDTAGIENLISVPSTDGTRLAADLERHLADYEVDVVTGQMAARLLPASVTPSGGPGALAGVELESGAVLTGRTVILATGARWRQVGVPGEQELRNKGVTYCPHCDGPLFKGKPVAVIGGGNSGVEAAIDLAGVASHVTLLEFADELKADAVLTRKLHSLGNVKVIVDAATTEIVGDRAVEGLVYRDRQTEEERSLAVEGIFVQIGLLPNTEWLRGTLPLSPAGEIEVDRQGATALPGVYAAGDVTTVPYKQIVVALGAGSTAALGAFDHLIRSTAPAEEPVGAGAEA